MPLVRTIHNNKTVLYPIHDSFSFTCRFRWVYCQIAYLRCCLPGRIRHALDELPETLDETYDRALREIDKANWKLAYRLL